VLAASDHTLIPHVIKHVIQEDMFHDFPRYRGETHQPVVPQVLLAPFLINGSDVTLLSVIRDFTRQPHLFKYDGGRMRINFLHGLIVTGEGGMALN